MTKVPPGIEALRRSSRPGSPGGIVVERFAGHEHEAGDSLGAARADHELGAAPVVAHERDVVEIEFDEKAGDHLRE